MVIEHDGDHGWMLMIMMMMMMMMIRDNNDV